MEAKDCSEGFCGIGHWQGVAEVFDGEGHFLGNGADQRHVRTEDGDGRTRIDLSFVGPLKFTGHYYIKNGVDHRVYQGPANCGFADALGRDGVTANAYWPSTGLSQKFFLLVSPDGTRQLSLALMSRGEHLLYAIVGENAKVIGDKAQVAIPIVNGGVYDLRDDPKAGRKQLLLHRDGYWEGELACQKSGEAAVTYRGSRHTVKNTAQSVTFTWDGSAFFSGDIEACLHTNERQAWTDFGDFVGAYSLYGGRAMAGQFHYLPDELRVSRREVVAADGLCKAVVNLWHRGEEKVGVEWGLLQFRESAV